MSEDVSLSASEPEEEGTTTIDTSKRDTTPPSKTVPSTESAGNDGGGKRGNGIYILVILLLLGGLGYMGYLFSEKNKAINICSNDLERSEQDVTDLNEMMYDQGLETGQDVKTNLENMLTMYGEMEKSNTDLNDSIDSQKSKINNLLLELEDAKKDKSRYASTVYKLQRETETLRSIMKDYIRTIDSLNVANGVLTESLAEKSGQLDDVTAERDNLSDKNEQLSDKVNKGSKLVASGFLTEGIRERGSGSFKETSKASRCTHIRSCFMIGANSIASPGNKTLYMRIISPDGNVLYSSNANSISLESGQSVLYSDKKTINYQNQEVDVCVFYKLTDEIPKGNYSAEIYSEGVKIGGSSFVLK